MKPRQLPWKWLALGFVVGALVSIPIVSRWLEDPSHISKRVTTELSKWSGGAVELMGPISVRYFPDVSVRGKFVLVGGTRFPRLKSVVAKDAKVSLDLVDMLRGRITVNALKLFKPIITLRRGAELEQPRTLVANLFAGGPVRVVHLRRGKLIFSTDKGREIVRDIDAHFDASDGAGAVSGFGSFTWRAEKVRFALDSGTLTQVADALTMPLTLKVTSTLINAKIFGTASFGDDFQLAGDMRLEMDDGRRFLSWTGIHTPDGQSLSRLAAKGAFHLSGATLTLDDGSFTIDGNKAIGLLAVTLGGKRPRVEGTLDFNRLVLDPYIGISPLGEPPTHLAAPGDRSLFDSALLKYFDADLRISAATIDAHQLRLGPSAFTVTAKESVIESEVGELDLCGGSATGRIAANLANATAQIRLTASLLDIIVDSCLRQLALPFPLAGIGSFKLELLSEGSQADELLRRLSGSLEVNARDGAVPIDFARLIGATPRPDGNGWSKETVTEFDALRANCHLGAGHMSCDTFTMQTPRELVSGSGDVDLPTQTLDWSLSVASPVSLVRRSPGNNATSSQLSIRGSLSQPMIRRADQGTLGDDATSTSSVAPAGTLH